MSRSTNTTAAAVSASVSQRNIDWRAAHVAAGAAVQAAQDMVACVNVAVVDAGGLFNYARQTGMIAK